jgi:hypothetical protein
MVIELEVYDSPIRKLLVCALLLPPIMWSADESSNRPHAQQMTLSVAPSKFSSIVVSKLRMHLFIIVR